MKSSKMKANEVTLLPRRMSRVSVMDVHTVRCMPEKPALICPPFQAGNV